jgi:hypothetical protein
MSSIPYHLTGIAGSVVLFDMESKSLPITNSRFGELYIKLILFNPMFNALFFVGGFYGEEEKEIEGARRSRWRGVVDGREGWPLSGGLSAFIPPSALAVVALCPLSHTFP